MHEGRRLFSPRLLLWLVWVAASAAAEVLPKLPTGLVALAVTQVTELQRVLDSSLLETASPQTDVVLALPDREVVLRKSRLEQRKDGRRLWIGRVLGYELSTVVLSMTNDTVYGRIEFDGSVYRIEPSGVQLRVTKEADNKPARYRADVSRPAIDTGLASVKPLAVQPKEDGSQIDVLLLYTPAMLNQYGSQLSARLNFSVDLVNAAYANSEILTRLRVVGTGLYDSKQADESNGLDAALDVLAADASVAERRDAVQADLVALLRIYGGTGNCGRAIMPGPPSRETDMQAFSVVEISPSQTGTYCSDLSLAHELGHNLGSNHDRDHALAGGAFAYSYGYDVPGVFGTVMSYDGPKISYFSTPLLNYQGYPLGLAEGASDAADNARSINQTRKIVANYRLGNGPLAPSVDLSLASAVTQLNDRLVYSLTVKNLGPGNASGLTLENRLPAGLSLLAASDCQVDARDAGKIVCPINVLLEGESESRTVVAQIEPDYHRYTVASNGNQAAVIVPEQSELNLDNNTSSLLPGAVGVYGFGHTGNAGGQVVSEPPGIDCASASGVCQATFVAGSEVVLIAKPNSGSQFDKWSGDHCANSRSPVCRVTVQAGRTSGPTTVWFKPGVSQPVRLQVGLLGNGGGTVVSDTGGIDCGAACIAEFQANSAVVLTAKASANAYFAGWQGGCGGKVPQCKLTLKTAKSVRAVFQPLPTLTVIRQGEGRVASALAEIDCGLSCSGLFAPGTKVELTAVPAVGYRFGKWSGACSGKKSVCTVTMTKAKRVTANFALLQ